MGVHRAGILLRLSGLAVGLRHCGLADGKRLLAAAGGEQETERGRAKEKCLFHRVTNRAFIRAIALSRRDCSSAICARRAMVAISPSMIGE